MKRRILVSIWMISMFLPSLLFGEKQDSPARILSLSDAQLVGMENNLDLRIARQELGLSRQTSKMAESSYLPDLSASAGYQYLDPPPAGKVELFPGLKKGIPMGFSHNWSIGLEARYLIYSGGKRDSGIEAAHLGEEAKTWLYKHSRRMALFEIRKAYFQTIFTQEAAALSRTAYDRARDRLERAEQEFETGTISRLELLRVRTEASDRKMAADEARDIARRTRDSLAATLDLPRREEIQLKFSLSAEGDRLEKWDTKALYLVVPEFAPARAAERAARAAEKKMEMERSDLLPKVSAGVRYDITNPYQMEQKTGGRFGAAIMATVPIYEGGRNRLEVDSARLEAQKARIQAKKIERELQILYDGTMDRIESLRNGLLTRKDGIQQAKATVQATEVALNNGAATHTELADAELLEFKMEVDRLRTTSELLIQLALWEQLGGQPAGIFPAVPIQTEKQRGTDP